MIDFRIQVVGTTRQNHTALAVCAHPFQSQTTLLANLVFDPCVLGITGVNRSGGFLDCDVPVSKDFSQTFRHKVWVCHV